MFIKTRFKYVEQIISSMRTPVVDGMFYEEDKEKLFKQIEECFLDPKLGPGTKEFSKGDNVLGVISPHAGYAFSGYGAAHCYKAIAEAEKADVYVIIGTSHSGAKGAAVTLQDFSTPLGIVETDKDFAKMLIEKGIVKDDLYPHVREHSVEVQLPFLQYIYPDAKIVPIVAGPATDFERFAKHFVEAVDNYGKKVVVIASSDFTHYGIHYSFIPFEDDVKNRIEDMDMKAIKFIKKLDAWSFLDYVKESGATICGDKAIACVVEICKLLKASKIKLLKYYTSGEISGDYSNCVGYGSIVIG